MTNTMENYIERTENRTNANLPKDNKKKQKEEKTQIDTKQVTPKHIENIASQQPQHSPQQRQTKLKI